MKKSFLLIGFLASMSMLVAQEQTQILEEGDIVTLGVPQGPEYQNIDFPRKNIIIKRGAIPNFNALVGEQLVVDRIETDKKGNIKTLLRRKDGLNFFRFFPTVKADVSKAMENGELRMSY